MKVGIDLGTTYSLIARLEPDGTSVLLPDSTDPSLLSTPSAVYLGETYAIVGHLVDSLLEENPDVRDIRYFKRHMGDPKPLAYDPRGAAWYAESVAALVLRKLALDAESFTSTKISGAVITVPAHFNDVQRKGVLAAAGLAEVPVLGLLEEPVAAALHYGISRGASEQVILVYDLGGGTFDATVLSLDAKGVYVLSKDGHTRLGGKEFDDKIAEMVLEQFKQLGYPATHNARTLLQLRRAAEEIKFELCMPNKTQERRVVMLGTQSAQVRITRDEFERRIEALLAETEAVTRRCVAGAGLQLHDIDAVLLVGGSSLVPAVERRIKAMMGVAANRVRFHEPMHAIAYGAAMHTAQLSGEAEQYALPPELRGVTGYNVGVRVIDPQTGAVKADTLIKKNMPLPARTTKTYYTAHERQQRVVLDLVQYRAAGEEMVGIGRLVVGPLPSPQRNYPIEVMVESREDGTIHVRAFDPKTRVELQQTFGRDGNDVFGHLAKQRMLVRNTAINSV